MTDYSEKLKRLAQQPAFKRWIFQSALSLVLFWKHVTDFVLYLNYAFPRRRFVLRKAPRAHYVGPAIEKPHRFAFMLLVIVLLGGVLLHPNPIYWVIGWGALFSILLIIHSAVRIAQGIRIRDR